MKTIVVTTIIATAAALCLWGQVKPAPASVDVPDAATAVRIAEKELAKVYGKKQIEKERPFTATLSDGIWHVTGTLYCKDERDRVVTHSCVGGVAMADIRQSDGRVLHTGHTK